MHRSAKEVGHKSVLIVRLVRSQMRIFFLSAYHMISRDKFVNYLKQVSLSNVLEAFLCGSIFNKAQFCLGEKHTLVSNEYSSRYNRV